MSCRVGVAGLLASGGGTADRCIRFWNTLTGSPLNCIDTGSQVRSLPPFSQARAQLCADKLAARCLPCALCAIAVFAAACSRSLLSSPPALPYPLQVCNLMWSKNINEVVSTHGYSLNQIIVWRYPSMAKVSTLTGHTLRVLYLAMSPDGQTIVTGAGDETLRFWNVFPTPKREC